MGETDFFQPLSAHLLRNFVKSRVSHVLLPTPPPFSLLLLPSFHPVSVTERREGKGKSPVTTDHVLLS